MHHLNRRLSLPSIRFHTVYAAFVLGVLLLQLFFWMSPTHKEAVSTIYLWPAAIAMFSLMLYRERKALLTGMVTLAAMVVWTFMTCLLNGDFYLTYNRGFMLGVVLAVGVCYPTLLMMDEPRRRRWLLILSISMVGMLTLLCWASFYAVATATLIPSPFGSPPLGIDPAIGDGRLYVFGEHPNGMACIFSIGLFLAVYLFLRLPSLWVRVLCVLAGLSLLGGVALTVSRTVFATVCGGMGLLSILCVLKACAFSKKWKCVLVCLLIAAIVIALVFVGLQMIGDFFADLSAQAEEMGFLQARSFGDNLGSLNQRDQIWLAGLRKIQERPITLLIGMLDSQVARLPMDMLNRPGTYHMHNVFLEVLMETGLIGLGLCLFFVWQLAGACVRLFFSKAAPLAARSLSIIPVTLLLNGMLEAYPFLGGRLMDMLFFLIAGAVIAYDRLYRSKPGSPKA